jgi:dTDP-glucose 4,6-dehydratase
MKTYLVTGGAGFIGANFVKYMIEKYGDENKIVVLDALTYAGKLSTIKHEIEGKKIEFVYGDICDTKLVESVFEKYNFDYVVNFAAESHVDRSINNPRIFLETNVLGTQNLLEVAKNSWTVGKDESGYPVYMAGKKYLQVSTDEVYGSLAKDYNAAKELIIKNEKLKLLLKDRGEILTYGSSYFLEETPLDPRSPYSASKAGADMIVRAYGETYKLPVNISRCSNNYGPYQFPEKLIPLMIKNVLEGKKLPVYGDGTNVRDWLYVEDHAKAIDIVLNRGKVGEVYNVGGYNEEKNINIVNIT